MCLPLRSRVKITAHVHYARDLMPAFFFSLPPFKKNKEEAYEVILLSVYPH
jgi:hypothetical protein